MRDGDKLPYWPAMMLRKTAASYCDMSEAAFEREVASGALPMPVLLGGKPHWHREQIDQHLALLISGGDWRATANLYREPMNAYDEWKAQKRRDEARKSKWTPKKGRRAETRCPESSRLA